MGDGDIIENLLYLEACPDWAQWERGLVELMDRYQRRRGTWSQLHHLKELMEHTRNMPTGGRHGR